MNDLYVMGAVCSRNKVNKRSLGRLEMTLDKVEMTRRKSLGSYVLCLATIMILFCVCLAHARQSSSPEAATGVALSTDSIKPLQIGDSIPSALWNLPLQMVKAGQEGSTTVTLNDYKGKLIILDFWATWCVPCVKSLAKLDSLQSQFGEKLAVIPTTYEISTKAKSFFTAKGWSLPSIVVDTVLKTYFPHQSIPHQVWIRDETVIAIAGSSYANAANIQKVIEGKKLKVVRRNKLIDFSTAKPLFVQGNGGDGTSMVYQSVIAKRLPASIGGVSYNGDNNILIYNSTISDLYAEAFRDEIGSNGIRNRIVWQMPDTLRKKCIPEGLKLVGDYEKDSLAYNWMDNNMYCYNLVYPAKINRRQAWKIMQAELNKVFGAMMGINGEMERKLIPTLSLTIPNEKLLRTEGRQKLLDVTGDTLRLVNQPFHVLESYLLAGLKHQDLPLYNNTKFSGNIDISLSLPLNNVEQVQRELRQYGINLEMERREMDVLVMKGGLNYE